MEIREAILDYLSKPHTHSSLIDAAKGLPEKFINENPGGLPYTFWQMLEHLRISQWDMVDFMVNPNYKEMEWPREYWPKAGEKATEKMWNDSVKAFEKDYSELIKIVSNKSNDLFSKIPHGSGQTIFREVMQIIDHNSYHIGQFIIMRRLINQWP